MRTMGGPKRMLHFYMRIFKRNQISVIMSVVLITSSIIILNLIVKIEKLKEEVDAYIKVINREREVCVATPMPDTIDLEYIPPEGPVPLPAPEETIGPVVPNMRRYAKDRLDELKRDLNVEEG